MYVVSDGCSPLTMGCQQGKTDVVSILCKHGANLHQSATKLGDFPLLLALMDGNEAIIDILISFGVNVYQVDHEGESSLYKASQKGHINIAKKLISSGADLNQRRKKDGYASLLRACVDITTLTLLRFL